MYTLILAPLDGSPTAEAALPHAEALAVRFGASLVLLRVVSPAAAVVPAMAPASPALVHPAGVVDPGRLLEVDRQEADNYLQAKAAELAARQVAAVAERQEGDPAEVIRHRARELRASVLVMTTHGRSGLGRLIFGSVADSVLRGSPCPVLLVRVAGEARAERPK
ncbi:MAG TPA: universal stress protein [Vicinamibacteria bacterium]|nr:universal stress protein [Vicinamibacteria bacterium]